MQQGIGYGTAWNCGTVWLNFKEKCGMKLSTVFSGILLSTYYSILLAYYSTEIWCYFFDTVPYSSWRLNLKSPKGLLC